MASWGANSDIDNPVRTSNSMFAVPPPKFWASIVPEGVRSMTRCV